MQTKEPLSIRFEKTIEYALRESQLFLKQFNLLKNPNVKKIIDLLDAKEELTITELQKETGIKTYNNTFLNVKKLEEVGIVVRHKDNSAPGRPVSVRLTAMLKRIK